MPERVFTILVIACGLVFLSVPIAAIWVPEFVTAGAAIHAGNLHRRPGRQADHYCRPTGLSFQLTETPPLVLLGGLIARPCRCEPNGDVKPASWHWFALRGSDERALFALPGIWRRYQGPVRKRRCCPLRFFSPLPHRFQ